MSLALEERDIPGHAIGGPPLRARRMSAVPRLGREASQVVVWDQLIGYGVGENAEHFVDALCTRALLIGQMRDQHAPAKDLRSSGIERLGSSKLVRAGMSLGTQEHECFGHG